MEKNTFKGKIVRLGNGFGFISGKAREIYFHCSALEWRTFHQLELGDCVEYELEDGPAPMNFGYQGGAQANVVRPD